jgi:antirestriction protein
MEEEPNKKEEREEGESERKDQPRIYVASLSDYNAGRLYGKWIDAAQEPEELEQAIKEMLAHSPDVFAEEWAIHDYEGFGSVRLSEYESLEFVSKLACGIAENGLAFAAWATICAGNEEALGRFDEAYVGNWESLEAHASDLLEGLGFDSPEELFPEWIRPYVKIDVEGFARDLELNGDVISMEAPDGSVWVFDGHV